MSSSKLYIVAYNIKNGGGRKLLIDLLKAVEANLNIVLLLNDKCKLPVDLTSKFEVRMVKATLIERIRAELWLFKKVEAKDLILCFGNLPPLLPLRGKIVLFLQNRFLIDSFSLSGFSFKTKLRIWIEKIWFRLCIGYVSKVVVQTFSMKSILQSKYPFCDAVDIKPFVNLDQFKPSLVETKKVKYDFIYPASGDPHKNHIRLIESWILLSNEGLFPSLCLTIDRQQYPFLSQWIELQVNRYNLNVQNVQFVDNTQLIGLYNSSNALIFPSLCESFGLPLIEARAKNLNVIASELDYVRDLVDPSQSFNPYSEISIALAVKRHLGIDVNRINPTNARDFIDSLYN